MIDIDIMNTTYQDIITSFLLNTMLHHVGMLWIIEAHEKLQYDMYKHISDWMRGDPWYNTYICKKLYGKVFEGFIRNEKNDRYDIMCDIDTHEKLIHKNVIIEESVVVIHYHQIQQQKH